ncbi:MAG: hypothetical protein CSA50_05580 [Gammaproteobacteria bacterium]|nr:MAG: hypothetical protein CSA50_05580 [Gammaproteobacteria bacterium]
MIYNDDELSGWIAEGDKRVETRLAALVRVYVEIVSGDPENGLPNEIVACETLDLSANGIQVIMPVELPVGALLPIVVEIGSQKFELVVETKWSGCMPDKGADTVWSTGFFLVDSDGSDAIRWKEAMVEWLTD